MYTNDGEDTLQKQINNYIGTFLTVGNDMYTKDISKKVITSNKKHKMIIAFTWRD